MVGISFGITELNIITNGLTIIFLLNTAVMVRSRLGRDFIPSCRNSTFFVTLSKDTNAEVIFLLTPIRQSAGMSGRRSFLSQQGKSRRVTRRIACDMQYIHSICLFAGMARMCSCTLPYLLLYCIPCSFIRKPFSFRVTILSAIPAQVLPLPLVLLPVRNWGL